MLLEIHNGTLGIGEQTLLSRFDFEIKGKEKTAIVGRNGCGKTTFLRLLAGELSLERDDQADDAFFYTSRKLTIGLLHQQAFSDVSVTLEEQLVKSCPCKDQWDMERFTWEQEYDRLLTGFGLSKEDKKKKLCEFSGGEQTKIAFIELLLQKPDLLLLDEPTNHLDAETTEWLEDYLHTYEHAVVMVSHDRFFLDQVADTVYEIQNQKMIRYVGNYTSYRQQKQKNLQLQEKAWQRQQAEIQKQEELIERFKHKPKKAAFARSRKKMLERMPKIEKPQADDAHMFTGPITPEVTSSKWVLEAEHLQIGYDRALLELSLRIRRGQKIGVIGPNGVGKSTFLKTAAGLIPPVKGKCAFGLHVLTGYFDQQSASLASEKSVAEHFHDLFPSMTEKEVRQTLGAFLFSGKEASRKVSQLSGGEKARLVLAELLKSLPNFLILDEPTNHMDIPAKETLESAFRSYTGTLLFVSHDRYFISQVADALLIFEDQSVSYYPFGYTHYVEQRKKVASGLPLSAQLKAEEQALISGLKNVPKAEHHRLREIPTEIAYQDWQMRLSMEPIEEIRNQLELLALSYDAFQAWENKEYAAQYAQREEKLQEQYTALCLSWYEKWLQFHPEPSTEL